MPRLLRILGCPNSTHINGHRVGGGAVHSINTRHPNTCEPNPERFAQEERSRALRFSGNGPVGGREYGSRANQELQALVHILTLPAALVSSIFSFALRFVRVPSTPFCAFAAEQVRRL